MINTDEEILERIPAALESCRRASENFQKEFDAIMVVAEDGQLIQALIPHLKRIIAYAEEAKQMIEIAMGETTQAKYGCLSEFAFALAETTRGSR